MRSCFRAFGACATASTISLTSMADPPPAPPPTPSASTVLSALPPPNLLVSIACAQLPFVTPDTGLRLTVDGKLLSLGRTDFALSTMLTPHGHEVAVTVPTDVAYAAPPGIHQLRIAAPGCADMNRTVQISPIMPIVLEGSLPTNPNLRGPVDAPDSFGFAIGGFYSSFPKVMTSGAVSSVADNPGHYAIDHSTAAGLSLSSGWDWRYVTMRIDGRFGLGSYSGEATPATNLGDPTARPAPLSGSLFTSSLAVRIGARLPLHYVALSAGSGIGGSVWTLMGAKIDGDANADTSNLHGITGIWEVPLWASVDLKPMCDWGVELTGSYDVAPTNLDSNTVTFGAALLWQPSGACSRTPHLDVVQP